MSEHVVQGAPHLLLRQSTLRPSAQPVPVRIEPVVIILNQTQRTDDAPGECVRVGIETPHGPSSFRELHGHPAMTDVTAHGAAATRFAGEDYGKRLRHGAPPIVFAG